MKTKLISLFLLPVLLLLTGCMKLDGNAEINKAGQINGTFTYTLEKSDAKMLDILTLDQFKSAAEQGGSSCTTNQYLEDNIKYTAICKYINANPGLDKRISVQQVTDKSGKLFFKIWYRQNCEYSAPDSCWPNKDQQEASKMQSGSVKIVLKLPGQKAYVDTIGDTKSTTGNAQFDADYEYVTITGYWTDVMTLGFTRDPNALNNRELREKAAAELKAKQEAEAKSLAEAKEKAEAEAIAAKQLAELQAKAKADAEIAAIVKQTQDLAIKLYSGKPCTKIKSTKNVSKIKFICIKSGNKLVWKKA